MNDRENNNTDNAEQEIGAVLTYFSTIANYIGVEVHAIWTRYGVILILQGLLFPLYAIVGDKWLDNQYDRKTSLLLVAISVFGLILTYCWWTITVKGWEYLDKWVKITKGLSKTLHSHGFENPWEIYEQWKEDNKKIDWINRIAIQMIVLVGVVHLYFLCCYGLYSLK